MRSMLTRANLRGLVVVMAGLGAAGVLAPAPVTYARQAAPELHVVPIRGNVFVIVGGGSNVTVSAGVDGLLLVDAGPADLADRMLETVLEIGHRVAGAPAPMTTCVGPSCYPAGSLGPFDAFGWRSPAYNAVIASPKPLKPIRWIIETTLHADHHGATPALAAAGTTYNGGEAGRLVGERTPATVIGHEFLLKRMTEMDYPDGAWPTETYYIPTYKMSQFINGEGIQMYHAPAANTDADTFVHFRYSDVISAGDLFTPGRYPMIDVDHGGTVQGVIDGLDQIIAIAFPEYRHQGGTMIVPGHGRLGDTADVAIYRNMITVVRDRIGHLRTQGMSLQQVKAERPTLDFDGIYGSPDAFIDAVYRTLGDR